MRPALLVLALTVLLACRSEDPVVTLPDSRRVVFQAPVDRDPDVDVLFVVGTPNCMLEEQEQLRWAFPALLGSLGSPRFPSKMPNLHVGIVSTDLGAGEQSWPGCQPGGDAARLQYQPRRAGCTPPADPFIALQDGVANVPGSSDAVTGVKEAFECIVELGNRGCGFIQALESARRALDAQLAVNPGFLRPDALLAVVFVTNMDDCSVQDPALFDPSPAAPDSLLGPPCRFRCFDLGFTCECDGQPCARYSEVDGYVSFFNNLKPPGRVHLYAIASPDSGVVETTSSGGCMHVQRACTTAIGAANPTLRVKALIDRFGDRGFYNTGLDLDNTRTEVKICSASYEDGLRFAGRSILTALTARCIPGPLLFAGPGASVACRAGDRPGSSASCPRSCLDRASCTVELAPGVPVQRCPARLFDEPQLRDCGATCPCWRIVATPDCDPAVAGSPYGVEILDRQPTPPGSRVRIECLVSTYGWGSPAIDSLPMCP